MPYQAPRGTHDVLPTQAPAWRHVVETFHRLVRSYGYGEIRTPMFEDVELFTRSSGETSDIVSKELYRFRDKGDRDLALKPEGTAPAIRAYLEHQLGQQGGTTRLWYFTPIFRYDRPQKGRFRQGHQVGLELIGSATPYADAEVIEVTYAFYRSLGIEELSLNLNSIGREDTRERYRSALLNHFASYLLDHDAEVRARAEKNPLRLLDSKDPKALALVHDSPSILDYLSDESRAHFEGLQELLTGAGVPFQVDPRIVRGLDYYTDTVFEVTSEALGAQSSLCGGGRYDGLVQELGGPATPAVGVAMGIERAIIAMDACGKSVPCEELDAFVVNVTPGTREAVLLLARELRQAGFSSSIDLDARAPKHQFKAADKSGAGIVLILGEDELARGEVTVKRMATGEQSAIPRESLFDWLKGARE